MTDPQPLVLRPPISLHHNPDPTDRTMEALIQSEEAINREIGTRSRFREREHFTLQELLETRLKADKEMSAERVASIRREIDIRESYRKELKSDSETHRLELKSDGEKTLTTATIAAEKAVQAALAAAEKARDQQTIASQLATTKAEEASKEQMKQQGETFSTDVRGLTSGLNDVKSLVGELRAERRGSQEQVTTSRDTAADMKPMVDAIMALTLAQANNTGKTTQIEKQGVSTGVWVGIGVAALTGAGALMLGVIDFILKLQA